MANRVGRTVVLVNSGCCGAARPEGIATKSGTRVDTRIFVVDVASEHWKLSYRVERRVERVGSELLGGQH